VSDPLSAISGQPEGDMRTSFGTALLVSVLLLVAGCLPGGLEEVPRAGGELRDDALCSGLGLVPSVPLGSESVETERVLRLPSSEAVSVLLARQVLVARSLVLRIRREGPFGALEIELELREILSMVELFFLAAEASGYRFPQSVPAGTPLGDEGLGLWAVLAWLNEMLGCPAPVLETPAAPTEPPEEPPCGGAPPPAPPHGEPKPPPEIPPEKGAVSEADPGAGEGTKGAR
jgi:hypothetical protein